MGQPDQIENTIAPVTSWCLGCDYPLKGLTENRCPECGRVFDPGHPDTMRTAQTPGKIARWLMQPPKWPSHSFTCLAALIMVASAAAPEGYFALTLISAYIWIVLLPGWFLRALACAFLRFRSRDKTKRSVGDQMRWLCIPAIFILTIALAVSSIPLTCAFVISRPAMNSLARSVMSNPARVHARSGLVFSTQRTSRPRLRECDSSYLVPDFWTAVDSNS